MARTRLLLIGGAAAAAAVVVVLVVVLAGGGSKSGSPTTTGAGTAPTPAQQEASFKGVPQHGATLGDPGASATLLVFEDPQCPFCREWSLGTLPSVIRNYVQAGKVKLVWYGIEIIGSDSLPGLRAIYAAALQDKLWNMTEALYQRQGAEQSGWITDSVIRDAARAAGANVDRLVADMKTARVTNAIRQSALQQQSLGVAGTPAFYIVRPPALPQQLQVTALDPATFSSFLSSALQ